MHHTSNPGRSSEAKELGRQYGLIFQGLAVFAYTKAVELGIDRLFFFTREGKFFQTVHETLFGKPQSGLRLMASQLLYASRQATFGPAIAAAGKVDLERCWALFPRISPRAFISSLNLDSTVVAEHLRSSGIPLDREFEMPGENDFQRILEDRVFSEVLQKLLDRQRQLALSYFSSQFHDRQRIGVVEIGWQGSIQDNLASMFPEKEFHGFYLGLTRAKLSPPKNSFKTALGPDTRRSRRHARLLDTADVLEFVASCPGGSVTNYEMVEGDEVVGVRRCDPLEDRAIKDFSLAFQQGVLETCVGSANRMLLAQGTQELVEAALARWQSLQNDPPRALVEAYYGLSSNEEFGTGGFRDQSKVPSWRTILLSPISGGERRRLLNYLKWSRWTAGVAHRQDIGSARRFLLSALIWLASCIRTSVMR